MEKIERLFNFTEEGILGFDIKGRICFWNNSAQKILGFSPEEVLKNFCLKMECGIKKEENLFNFAGDFILYLVKKGQPIPNFSIQVRSKKGSRVYLNISSIIIEGWEKGRGKMIALLFRPVLPPESKRPLKEPLYSISGFQKGNKSFRPNLNTKERGIFGRVHLTKREKEILEYLARGMGLKEISSNLAIALPTVRTHIHHILKKLGVHNKLAAVMVAIRQNILKGPSIE